MKIKKVKIFFVLFVICIIFNKSAFACWCVGPEVGVAIQEADIAFIGTVKKIDILEDKDPDDEHPVRVKFNVLYNIKKDTNLEKNFILYTNDSTGMCNGYPFKLGKTYRVITNKHEEVRKFESYKTTFPKGSYGEMTVCNGTAEVDPKNTKIG